MWFESVDTAGLQPLVAPLFEIEGGAHACVILRSVCFLESADEVRELGIRPLVFLEVLVECLFQVVLSEHFVRLLQERCSFSV